MMKKLAVTLILCLALTGCASTGSPWCRKSIFENSYVKDVMGGLAGAANVIGIIGNAKKF